MMGPVSPSISSVTMGWDEKDFQARPTSNGRHPMTSKITLVQP